VLKINFADFNETTFHVERPFERIFYILGIEKSDLDEIAKVMFQVDEWTRDLIICPLDVLKKDFGEVVEAMFQGVERPCELIFCVLVIEKNDFD
jgi:hypothetical protein